MEIKVIGTSIDQKAVEKTQGKNNKALEKNGTDTTKGAQRSDVSDRVQLSRQYQEISAVKRVTMELSDIRQEQVDLIRNKIENGTYTIRPDEISEKMTEELF